MKERVMPHNIEAEQSVLGSMFLSKYALQKCIESLDASQFFLDSHNKIFKAISELSENGKPIDITTVTAELDKKKELTQVGGVEYIAEIMGIFVSHLISDVRCPLIRTHQKLFCFFHTNTRQIFYKG